MYILGRKSLALVGFFRLASDVRLFEHGLRLLFELIQADGRFQHEQDIEALLAYVLHNAGDMF